MEVLSRFIKNGRIIIFPKKQKNKKIIMEYVVEYLLRKGNTFTEQQLNEAIYEIFDDYVLMRRYLVDYKLITRDKYGSKYTILKKEDV